ncbi:MAG: hypothetical protein SF052_11770 [Bacteroidia bacterium]|nr:hypothetical protein [Bacteroidia bacterium]
MNPRMYAHILALMCLIQNTWIFAQDVPLPETVAGWYIEQVFLAVDRDVNDQIARGELRPFAVELGWFMDEANFREADLNTNGGLEREEIRLFMGEAQVFRAEEEAIDLKILNQKYPYFSDAKPAYFRRHPELVSMLLGNRIWTREHPETIKIILGQNRLLEDEPELIGALHRNMAFLTEHPAVAMIFYEMKETRSFQPMTSWRARHQEFIKSSPGMEQQIYRIEFPRYQRPLKPQTPEPPLAAAKAEASPTARLSESTPEKPEIIDLGAAGAGREKELHTPVSKGDNTQVSDLEKQIRYLRIEAQLARVEEDSLLAETIRQRKYIALLEKNLDSLNNLPKQKPEIIVEKELADCSEAEREAENYTREIARIKTKNDSLYKAVQTLQKNPQLIASHRSQITTLESKIQEQDSRVWEYKLAIKEKDKELEDLKKKQLQQETLLAQIEKEKQTWQLTYRFEKDSLTQKVADLQKSLDAVYAEIATDRKQQELQAVTDARRINEYQRKIDEISYDNDKLREQLEFALEHSAENENSLEQQIILAKADAEKLLAQNDRLKRRKKDVPVGREIITLTRELEDAESRIAELLVKNQSLKYQLSSSFAYLDQTVAQQQQLETEIQSQIADITRLSHLRDSISHSVQKVTQTNWTDSMQVYRQRLNQAEAKLVEYQLSAQREKAVAEMAKDSLRNEILRMNDEKKKLSAMEQVNIARINSIEARETELKKLEIRITERNQLAEQREAFIREKLADLAIQEKKYQDLLEREKNLDLREQRIKQRSGAN